MVNMSVVEAVKASSIFHIRQVVTAHASVDDILAALRRLAERQLGGLREVNDQFTDAVIPNEPHQTNLDLVLAAEHFQGFPFQCTRETLNVSIPRAVCSVVEATVGVIGHRAEVKPQRVTVEVDFRTIHYALVIAPHTVQVVEKCLAPVAFREAAQAAYLDFLVDGGGFWCSDERFHCVLLFSGLCASSHWLQLSKHINALKAAVNFPFSKNFIYAISIA